MTDTTDTGTLILNAALKVFTEKGFAASRTADIAREAGINRALLHYYYRDKETIFNLIFETQFREFFGGIAAILGADQAFEEKIRQLIRHEIGMLQRHPHLARFIITEVAREPERLLEMGKKMNINPQSTVASFVQQVNEEVLANRICAVDGKQLLMNIMSLCIYPFVAQPIVKTMLQLDDYGVNVMMEERKQFVYETIINAIRK
jgi:AcrR family transcriptional regulator